MSKKKTKKIYSAAFPLNECNEAVSLKPISEIHKKLLNIEINPDLITYHPIDISYIEEVILLHKEWFPVDYDDNFFEEIFDNNCCNYFTIGAFYNIKNEKNNENKEIILGLALCEWEYISDYFIEHTNPKAIEEISKNINITEEVQACLKCQMYHCVYIMTIGVLDGCRQMSIGSNMLNNIFNIALRDDICVGIYLDVIYYNKSAIKFYEKNNFKKVKEIKDYYDLNGKNYDANVYLRIITRKEKDEFRAKNRTYFNKIIHKYIINPIKFVIKIILYALLLQCLRKK
jgi:hypothetical protein